MADNDLFANADRLLAAIDFSAMQAATEEKHKKELARLLFNLLPVLDSLEALENHCCALVAAGKDHVPLRSVSVALRLCLQVLEAAGLEKLNTLGSQLDLDRHEVVAARFEPSAQPDTVVEEILGGYLWRGQLLRCAKVVVSGGEGVSDQDSPNFGRGGTDESDRN